MSDNCDCGGLPPCPTCAAKAIPLWIVPLVVLIGLWVLQLSGVL